MDNSTERGKDIYQKRNRKAGFRRNPWQINMVGVLGVLLLLSEIWKQWYGFFVIGNQNYNWWYFPFQLCSLPIYLAPCLLIFKDRRKKQIIVNFLHDFNMLGAIAVFLDTSGMIHESIYLTIHSFAFHIVLIIMGILIHSCDYMDTSWGGFFKTTCLFGVFSLIAILLNTFLYPKISGDINMFYVNCYYPNTQIVFRNINKILPTYLTNALYLAVIVLGAAILHKIMRISYNWKGRISLLKVV